MAELLDRLERVRETGPGRYIARCPAHDDRSPSLSIQVIEDDRTLVHCFGGCDALSIVRSIGLELRDLFDDGEVHRSYSDRKYRSGKYIPRIPAGELLDLLDHELRVAALLASDFLTNKRVTEDEWQRLALAVGRVGKARAMHVCR